MYANKQTTGAASSSLFPPSAGNGRLGAQQQKSPAPHEANQIFATLKKELLNFYVDYASGNAMALHGDKDTVGKLAELKQYALTELDRLGSHPDDQSDQYNVVWGVILSKKPEATKTTNNRKVRGFDVSGRVVETTEIIISTVEHPFAEALQRFVDSKRPVPAAAATAIVVREEAAVVDVEAIKRQAALEERARLAQQLADRMPQLRRLMGPGQRQELFKLLGAQAAVSTVAQLLENQLLSAEDAQDLLSSLLSRERCNAITALATIVRTTDEGDLQHLVAKHLILNLIVYKGRSIAAIFTEMAQRLLDKVADILLFGHVPGSKVAVTNNTLKELDGFAAFRTLWEQFTFSDLREETMAPTTINHNDECKAFFRLFSGEGGCLSRDGTAKIYFSELMKRTDGLVNFPPPVAYEENFNGKVMRWKDHQQLHSRPALKP